MKNVVLIGVSILLLAGAIWIWHWRQQAIISAYAGADFTGADNNEDYTHKLTRFRAEAETALRKTCTNDVVGLRSIIDLRTDTYDDNFMKWTASATVEFINASGGVERTNLDFKFDTIGGDICWFQK